ncbi:AsmA family protein [Sphingomonas sp. HF-S4]|uniref:AsmA family protein n=1 Tax=Sphingomonas agrestis TaxID=3080540 RepID=A0ABU3Y3I9_9SPHN|nr:AsmA family protein [Sphingomonas sp. HF-S4]MDV3455930.1 AsmA family protein [Sphingomonas sp. HF-S4]
MSRRVRNSLIAAAVVAGLLVLLAGAFPVSWFRGTVERTIASRFDTPVRIGALEREDFFSFAPIVQVRDIHIAQPQWAGQGDLASVRSLRLKLRTWGLLLGKVDAEIVSAEGVRLNLVRDAQRRANWKRDGDKAEGGGGSGIEVAQVRDAVIRYRDAVQRREFTLNVAINPDTGLAAKGNGQVDGAPVTLAARAAPMRAGQPWAFDATIDGAALGLTAKGSMAGPLRTDRMEFDMTARGDDLKRIDRIIEAGLFGTQPVKLAAHVRREDDAWIVERLRGTIGVSALSGRVTARKADGRTKLDGAAHFSRLRFDDLADNEGLAKQQALTRAIGPRVVPNTRINIAKIDKTDGQIAVRIDQIVGSSTVRGIRGTLKLDDRILTIDDLRIALARGTVAGRLAVDQRAGQPKPKVTLALDMANSSISALFGGGEVDGRLDARVRLAGVGDTIREAVGRSDGTIGVAARAGALPAKMAALMGFDIGKGLLGGDKGQAALRCAVVRLSLRGGRGVTQSLLIDTSLSQSRGTGSIGFPDERLALTLTGAPKGKGILRLPGSVSVNGTISAPEIVVPKETKSVGNVFKALGRAVTGSSGPAATDADCGALVRGAIG